jgi:hypothetical protein
MFRNLDKSKARTYSAAALAPMVLGVVAAAWALQSEGTDHNARVDQIKPTEVAFQAPPPPATDPVGPKGPDPAVLAARFDAIANKPVPIPPESPIVEPEPEPPAPTPDGDLKYVGQVKVGSLVLALMSIDGSQRAMSKGRSFTYKAGESSQSAKIVKITDTEVTIDAGGTERVIARSDHGGDVVSYLGGKPTRKVVMKKRDDLNTMGDGTHPLDANAEADYATRRAEALAKMAPYFDKIMKSKDPEIAKQLRDKIAESLKKDGIDPSMMDEMISNMKEMEGK